MSSTGLRLLSLDGGGIRGLSELIILKEIMRRIQHDKKLPEEPKPCELFDMIGGTSTGGLIALLLGRLRLSTQEAIDVYGELAKKIFSETKFKGKDGTFKASALEKAIKSILKSRGCKEDERMLDIRDDTCKTFVCATAARSMSSPCLFRTYSVRENPSYNCTIWEAARATTAAPTFFKRIKIGEKNIEEEFIDGGIGCNNPTHQLVLEARRVLGDNSPIDCILSIGTGHPSTIGLTTPDAFQRLLPTGFVKVLRQIATDCESNAEEYERKYVNEPNVYFRFNVDHGMENITLAEWRKLGEIVQHTKQYLQRAMTNSKVDSIVKILCPEHTQASPLPPMTKSVVPAKRHDKPKKVPIPTSAFTGREYVLTEMDQFFDVSQPSVEARQRRIFVLHGLGGAGKTQIALKFVNAYSRRFSRMFWIDSASEQLISVALTSIAIESGSGDSLDDALTYLADCPEEWLLLFDNADDADLNLGRFFPQCMHGNIIITTRNPQLTIYSPDSHYLVSEMTADDSVDLLLRLSGVSRSDAAVHLASVIVKELGHLALAITQAGSYIHQNTCSFQEYLRSYTSNRNQLLSQLPRQRLDHYENTVYTTWEMSFARLKCVSQSLLEMFSYLHYENISREIFERAVYSLDDEDDDYWNPAVDFLTNFRCTSGEWDEIGFTETISDIASYSLVSIDFETATYSIHPLVHAWCRERSERSNTTHICTMQTLALSVTYGESLPEVRYRRSLVPHVDSCIIKGIALPEKLANKFHEVYFDGDRFYESALMLQPRLEAQKAALGEDDAETLATIHDLGVTYMWQDRLTDAEELFVSLVEKRKLVLGEDHPDTLESIHSLGVLYSKQDRLAEAEAVFVPLVEKRKLVLGEDHTETLRSIQELGVVYLDQDRTVEAEEVFVPLVEKRKLVLGEDHLDTLSSIHSLGVLYLDQDLLAEAEAVVVPLVEKRKLVLGEDHPNTLKSIHSLGVLYRKQDRLAEAEAVLVPLVEKRKLVLGEDHPDTLKSIHSLGVLYAKQDRLAEAEAVLVPLVEKRKLVLGEDHPNTLNSIRELGVVYSERDRSTDAIFNPLVDTCKPSPREEHPDALPSISSLDVSPSKQDWLAEAEVVFASLID